MYVSLQFIPIDSFEGQSSAGQMVVVVAGGKNIPLHFHNRLHYVDTVLNYRLHEWDKQVRQFNLVFCCCECLLV